MLEAWSLSLFEPRGRGAASGVATGCPIYKTGTGACTRQNGAHERIRTSTGDVLNVVPLLLGYVSQNLLPPRLALGPRPHPGLHSYKLFVLLYTTGVLENGGSRRSCTPKPIWDSISLAESLRTSADSRSVVAANGNAPLWSPYESNLILDPLRGARCESCARLSALRVRCIAENAYPAKIGGTPRYRTEPLQFCRLRGSLAPSRAVAPAAAFASACRVLQTRALLHELSRAKWSFRVVPPHGLAVIGRGLYY